MDISRKFLAEVELTEHLKEIKEFVAISTDEEIEELFEDARRIVLYDGRISPFSRYQMISLCDIFEESVGDIFTKANKTINIGAAGYDLISDLKNKIDALSKDYVKARRNIKVASAVAVAALIVSLSRKYYRKAVHGSCSKYKGRDLVLCRVKMVEQFERVLSQQMKYCDKTTDPIKCKNRVKKSMERLEREKRTWLKKKI